MTGFNRREFLSRVGRATLGSAAIAALPPWTRAALAAGSVPADRIVRNDWPEHWETTIAALDRSWVTPNDAFFVHSHFPVPVIDFDNYRLEVTGKVNDAFSLSLGELRELPLREAHFTLECAGNGRSFYGPSAAGGAPSDEAESESAEPVYDPASLHPPMQLPSRPSRSQRTPWGLGAVGNAQWGGVRLATLLDRAGLKADAAHVWFEAADEGRGRGPKRFVRSIPLRTALGDVMLAYSMNGVPLPAFHGAPVRAVVPGWYAMASTKWVTRVRVESRPSHDHFMSREYVLDREGEPQRPLEAMRVKSLVTTPRDGDRIATGVVRFEGYAWAGAAEVRVVEVSVDRGKSWKYAGFMDDRVPNAWRRWATEVEFERPGAYTVMARATDGNGDVQPEHALANAGGYANNSIQRVAFTLQGQPPRKR